MLSLNFGLIFLTLITAVFGLGVLRGPAVQEERRPQVRGATERERTLRENLPGVPDHLIAWGMPIALLTLLTAMASIQFGASQAKQLFPLMGPIGTSAWRLGLAAIMLGLVMRPWRHPLTRAQLPMVFRYGAALGFMNLTFYLALQRIPLGVAVALEFTGPLCLAIFSSRRKQDLIWVVLAATGLALLFPWANDSHLDLWGMALAVVAGACWACYIVYGQKLGQALKGPRAVAWGMTAAAACVIPFGFVQSQGTLWHPDLLVPALLVALLSSALPYSLEMIALRRLPSATFSILMSLEPAVAMLMGWIFLNEALSKLEMVAITCIVVASLGSALSTANQKKTAELPA